MQTNTDLMKKFGINSANLESKKNFSKNLWNNLKNRMD